MNVRTLAPFLVLALVACGGNPSVANPTPGPTCGPTSVSAQLVYPVPGATAVPDTITQIVIATSPALPSNSYNLSLSGSNGFGSQTANYLVQIAANQVPPGSASVSFANPSYMSVQLVSAFPSAQPITTIAINNPLSNCTPLTIPGASFTTQ